MCIKDPSSHSKSRCGSLNTFGNHLQKKKHIYKGTFTTTETLIYSYDGCEQISKWCHSMNKSDKNGQNGGPK